MRELKFRYVFKKPNGHIVKYYTDIQHLEHGDMADFLQHNFLSVERDLLSRDLYTGLKDRNNTEIYDDDIVHITLSGFGIEKDLVVEWEDGKYKEPMFEDYHREVIGNIFENKEKANV